MPAGPDSTPGYSIRGYPGLLATAGDLIRLSTLARDRHRHAFLLRATGSDYVALSEIRTVQSVIADKNVLDLQTFAELAAYRHLISVRNQSIPSDLPAVWARLARVDHAEALARSITDLGAQTLSLSKVVTAIAQAGDPDRAEALARTIADPYAQAHSLSERAIAIAQAGLRPRRGTRPLYQLSRTR